MRSLMFATFFAGAMFFFAPDASASQQTAPEQQQASEEAPVDVEAERLFCPRRIGGPSQRRRMASCATAAAERQDFGDVTCAARYEHRGHRRVHLRLNQCRPLFQRGTSSI